MLPYALTYSLYGTNEAQFTMGDVIDSQNFDTSFPVTIGNESLV